MIEHVQEAATGWTMRAEDLPRASGAYVVLLKLVWPVPLPSRWAGKLPPGRYGYVGSAAGPGGIRARCGRHLRVIERKRWHIDWLTSGATWRRALALPGRSECELMERLLLRREIAVPIKGFGSSDCRRCPAHMVRLDAELDLGLLARWLRD